MIAEWIARILLGLAAFLVFLWLIGGLATIAGLIEAGVHIGPVSDESEE